VLFADLKGSMELLADRDLHPQNPCLACHTFGRRRNRPRFTYRGSLLMSTPMAFLAPVEGGSIVVLPARFARPPESFAHQPRKEESHRDEFSDNYEVVPHSEFTRPLAKPSSRRGLNSSSAPTSRELRLR
jgi:hypothetical protein